MNRAKRASRPSEPKSAWPDLQHKYGKVGIAAVAAAVVPDSEAARRRAAQDESAQDASKARRGGR